jgi:peptide deformylase
MNLVTYPNPSLDQVCDEVTKFDFSLQILVSQMIRILIEQKGMGLAANQIGSLHRVFIMKDLKTNNIITFVNPVILEKEGKINLNEGCLSFPGLIKKKDRSQQVRVKAQNIQGQFFEIIAEDLEAVCIQHELEHLNGKNFL